MRRAYFTLMAFIAAATLSACGAPAFKSAARGAFGFDGGPCGAFVRTPWTVTSFGAIDAEAHAKGRCDNAAVSLALRDGQGRVYWSDSFASAQLFGFEDVINPDEMRESLREWITPPDTFASTADLPRWRRGQATPVRNGEFPFIPHQAINRRAYNRIRRADLPMFCYVQGLESVFCVALSGDETGVIALGSQTFPG